MTPMRDPLWNKEYINQRLHERKISAEIKRISNQTNTVDNSAEYWFGEYLEEQRRNTELETENEKLRIMVRALLNLTPTERTTIIKEVW